MSASEEDLRAVIRDLDQRIPREGARVEFCQYGGADEEGAIIANQRGYLRLGIEFLKAAFAPTIANESGQKDLVEAELEYLISSNSTIGFKLFERREPDPERNAELSSFFRVLPYLLIGFLLSFLAFAVVGFVTVARWIGRAWTD